MPSRIFSLAFQLGTFIQENSGIQEYENNEEQFFICEKCNNNIFSFYILTI